MVSSNEQAHDVGLLHELTGCAAVFTTWRSGSIRVADLYRAADIILESGHALEFGPGKHGMGDKHYLSPRTTAGIRVELFSGGDRNYQPDWEPVKWAPSQGSQRLLPQLADAGQLP